MGASCCTWLILQPGEKVAPAAALSSCILMPFQLFASPSSPTGTLPDWPRLIVFADEKLSHHKGTILTKV
jgi:hypothetical protein